MSTKDPAELIREALALLEKITIGTQSTESNAIAELAIDAHRLLHRALTLLPERIVKCEGCYESFLERQCICHGGYSDGTEYFYCPECGKPERVVL